MICLAAFISRTRRPAILVTWFVCIQIKNSNFQMGFPLISPALFTFFVLFLAQVNAKSDHRAPVLGHFSQLRALCTDSSPPPPPPPPSPSPHLRLMLHYIRSVSYYALHLGSRLYIYHLLGFFLIHFQMRTQAENALRRRQLYSCVVFPHLHGWFMFVCNKSLLTPLRQPCSVIVNVVMWATDHLTWH